MIWALTFLILLRGKLPYSFYFRFLSIPFSNLRSVWILDVAGQRSRGKVFGKRN